MVKKKDRKYKERSKAMRGCSTGRRKRKLGRESMQRSKFNNMLCFRDRTSQIHFLLYCRVIVNQM